MAPTITTVQACCGQHFSAIARGCEVEICYYSCDRSTLLVPDSTLTEKASLKLFFPSPVLSLCLRLCEDIGLPNETHTIAVYAGCSDGSLQCLEVSSTVGETEDVASFDEFVTDLDVLDCIHSENFFLCSPIFLKLRRQTTICSFESQLCFLSSSDDFILAASEKGDCQLILPLSNYVSNIVNSAPSLRFAGYKPPNIISVKVDVGTHDLTHSNCLGPTAFLHMKVPCHLQEATSKSASVAEGTEVPPVQIKQLEEQFIRRYALIAKLCGEDTSQGESDIFLIGCKSGEVLWFALRGDYILSLLRSAGDSTVVHDESIIFPKVLRSFTKEVVALDLVDFQSYFSFRDYLKNTDNLPRKRHRESCSTVEDGVDDGNTSFGQPPHDTRDSKLEEVPGDLLANATHLCIALLDGSIVCIGIAAMYGVVVGDETVHSIGEDASMRYIGVLHIKPAGRPSFLSQSKGILFLSKLLLPRDADGTPNQSILSSSLHCDGDSRKLSAPFPITDPSCPGIIHCALSVTGCIAIVTASSVSPILFDVYASAASGDEVEVLRSILCPPSSNGVDVCLGPSSQQNSHDGRAVEITTSTLISSTIAEMEKLAHFDNTVQQQILSVDMEIRQLVAALSLFDAYNDSFNQQPRVAGSVPRDKLDNASSEEGVIGPWRGNLSVRVSIRKELPVGGTGLGGDGLFLDVSIHAHSRTAMTALHGRTVMMTCSSSAPATDIHPSVYTHSCELVFMPAPCMQESNDGGGSGGQSVSSRIRHSSGENFASRFSVPVVIDRMVPHRVTIAAIVTHTCPDIDLQILTEGISYAAAIPATIGKSTNEPCGTVMQLYDADLPLNILVETLGGECMRSKRVLQQEIQTMMMRAAGTFHRNKELDREEEASLLLSTHLPSLTTPAQVITATERNSYSSSSSTKSSGENPTKLDCVRRNVSSYSVGDAALAALNELHNVTSAVASGWAYSTSAAGGSYSERHLQSSSYAASASLNGPDVGTRGNVLSDLIGPPPKYRKAYSPPGVSVFPYNNKSGHCASSGGLGLDERIPFLTFKCNKLSTPQSCELRSNLISLLPIAHSAAMHASLMALEPVKDDATKPQDQGRGCGDNGYGGNVGGRQQFNSKIELLATSAAPTASDLYSLPHDLQEVIIQLKCLVREDLHGELLRRNKLLSNQFDEDEDGNVVGSEDHDSIGGVHLQSNLDFEPPYLLLADGNTDDWDGSVNEDGGAQRLQDAASKLWKLYTRIRDFAN